MLEKIPEDVASFLISLAEYPIYIESGDPVLADEFDEEVQRARQLCEKYNLSYYVTPDEYDDEDDED